MGISEALRTLNPAIEIVAVEPAESAVLSGGPTGAHNIDGIGAGFVVPLWHSGIANLIERVTTQDAAQMALRLAREEGLFVGASTGANVIAAMRIAERLGPGETVVTVMCGTDRSLAACCRLPGQRALDRVNGVLGPARTAQPILVLAEAAVPLRASDRRSMQDGSPARGHRSSVRCRFSVGPNWPAGRTTNLGRSEAV